MKCYGCGRPVHKDDKFCGTCGRVLQYGNEIKSYRLPFQKTCRQCGHASSWSALHCGQCGELLAGAGAGAQPLHNRFDTEPFTPFDKGEYVEKVNRPEEWDETAATKKQEPIQSSGTISSDLLVDKFENKVNALVKDTVTKMKTKSSPISWLALFSGLAVSGLLLYVVAVFVSADVTNYLEVLFVSNYQYYSFSSDQGAMTDMLSFRDIDVFLTLNQLSFTSELLSTIGTERMEMLERTISTNLVSYLPVVSAVLFLGGIMIALVAKQMNKQVNLGAIIMYGALYGILLAILSVLGSQNEVVEGWRRGAETTVSLSYNPFEAFGNGFLLAFLFGWLGIMVVKKWEFLRDPKRMFTSLSPLQSSFLFGTGAAVLSIVLLLVVYYSVVDVRNEQLQTFLERYLGQQQFSSISEEEASTYVGRYALLFVGLAHFAIFSMQSIFGGPTSYANYSLWGIGENTNQSVMDQTGFRELLLLDSTWALFIPLVMIVTIGALWSKRFGFRWMYLLVFSLVYSFVVTFFVQFATTTMNIRSEYENNYFDNIEAMTGFMSVQLFFTTFLVVVVAVMSGGLVMSRLNRNRLIEHEEHVEQV
ncbi:zinc ribbon domain-containing protein [Bacillus fonticola]|uniref:zinc ribbon domain-containing protein n=1 Tax=Bacillus fonticola TaxID=2728853 RepID=UPI0014745CF2|nr:zinc ribbon domain-containing protein [Bacillus fonticola]